MSELEIKACQLPRLPSPKRITTFEKRDALRGVRVRGELPRRDMDDHQRPHDRLHLRQLLLLFLLPLLAVYGHV